MTGHTELEETARIARDLIRIDTTNYGEGRSVGETEAAEYVEARLLELGLKPQLFESEPGRVSVIANVEGAPKDSTRTNAGPAASAPHAQRGKLVVHGHLDVVPAIAEDWSVDPFEGVIKDGMLWGRGAVDMKNMDAMILTALGDILGSGRQPARDLIIAFFADEEAGGVLGSGHLVREHPELFAGATEAISEVGGYSITVGDRRAYLLQTGEKALVWAKLVARGTAGHGSRIHPDNAITKLAEAVAKVARLQWPVRLTDTTEHLLRELARILDVDPQRVGPDELALATGTASAWIQASLRNTVNPTMLTSGYKHNVIPDRAEAALDIRAFPGEEDTVLQAIQDAVGPDIEVVTSFRDVGTETTFDGQLVDTVKRTLQRHDPGVPVLPYLLAAGTDNKALSKLGIRGFGFAPLKLPADLDFTGMFHGVDERVPLDALAFGRDVLKDFLLEY